MKNAKEILELRKNKLQRDKDRIGNLATRFLIYNEESIESLLINNGRVTIDIRKPTNFPTADSDQWRSLSAEDYIDVCDEITDRFRNAGFMVVGRQNCRTITLPEEEEPKKPTSCECDNTHDQNHTVCRYCWANGRRHPHDPDVPE